jgi:hypothetical protein
MRLRTLILLTIFLLPLPLLADTYTYTYTGNDYQPGNFLGTTGYTQPYTASDFQIITFTLSAPLGDNLSGGPNGYGPYITPVSWSFYDGVQTDTSADPAAITIFQFLTNGNGQIVNWILSDDFGTLNNNFGATNKIVSVYEPPFDTYSSYDISWLIITNGGQFYVGEHNNPGVWTVSESLSSPVPEGPSLVYMLLGAACCSGFAIFDSRRRVGADAGSAAHI